MAVTSRIFSLLPIIFLTITISSTTTTTAATTIGVTLNNHPNTTTFSPEQLATALHREKITSLRLLDADPSLIRAFTYSPISLLLTIPNALIPSLAANQSNAAAWLYKHVVPFYPRANITAISVGSDVTASSDDVTDSLLPAIRNIHVGLHQLGIRHITVSTTFSVVSALTTAFPPSAAEFQEPINDVIIRPLLDFLEEAKSSFLINLYPYTIYRDVTHEIPLGFALFQETPFNHRDDPTTGVRYRNLFDVMVDAVLAAMAVAGHENIPLIVAETGWPSSTGSTTAATGEESDANPVIAEMYLSGLIKHLKSGKGTPLKKDGVSEVYVYELFDHQQGSDSVRNWGILYPNLTTKYKIDFSGATKLKCDEADFCECIFWHTIVIYMMGLYLMCNVVR